MSNVKIEGNASGTGTFTIAAPNSNTDRTLTLPDEAGTVLTSAGAGTDYLTPTGDGSGLTGIAGGISEADMWGLTSTFTADAVPISSNLSRKTGGFGSALGTGMSQSSGVFTFPSTGYWLVFALRSSNSYANPTESSSIVIRYTPDNGSNWHKSVGAGNAPGSQRSGYATGNSNMAQSLIDVTDTSLVKVRFEVHTGADGSNYTYGDTDGRDTQFGFIKLGET